MITGSVPTAERADAYSQSVARELKAVSIEWLNDNCFCVSLDATALADALESELGEPGLYALLKERCPFLFSAHPVFISQQHMQAMSELIGAVESVVALPHYRARVLARSPPIARHDPGGAKGVFFGYDFHVTAEQVGLIEVNTNAGGAMLNALMARAQRACCGAVQSVATPATAAEDLEAAIVAMFRSEWTHSGRKGPLRTIAIVDREPTKQYLYPEFLLFRRLFERHGLQAVIADPTELTLRDGVLLYKDIVIDLVYNRLTDFMLADPESATLRDAYLGNAALLTPHPRAHAMYADKRNLALLGDAAWLEQIGVPAATRAVLASGIPATEVVDVANAERLWANRSQLFFKPVAGYGGRAAYRGDKLTRRVWQEILKGEYVAQALLLPGERAVSASEPALALKFDLRDYVYDGAVQWVAARLYQGQTTNFRTPGGGFAPVHASLVTPHSFRGCDPRND